MGWLRAAIGLIITGLVLITIFAAFVWWPLAFLIVGISLIVGGVFLDSPRKRPPAQP
jgi:membrane-bound ClpP family serine protease